MRDVNRINKILKELETYWRKNPDLRLCQIVWNLGSNECSDPFFTEDEIFLKKLIEENEEEN